MQTSVLVVDDEAFIRHNLCAYLEDEGMSVTTVASAEEAVARVAAGVHFSVCIMNIRLPGMDGNAAISLLHSLYPSLRFIVHTGTANYSLPNELRTIGLSAEHVCLKPLDDMAVLAGLVNKLAAAD